MKSYIGYSTNSDIRYKATSGGIGTTIIKWLFDNKLIGTSISFEFDPITLRYVPKIIHSFDEYQICGSIYQEIDLIGFVKSHQNEIKGTLACFALPCQTKAIKSICERYGHKVFIIGLTCSSQQTLDATKYLLKRINIKTVLIQEYSEITERLQSIKRLYNGRTVYLSGAAAEYNPDGKDAYEKFISKLSGRLIYEGYKIVSGYGLGVGSAVISGALSEIYYNQKKSLTDQLILRPFPQGDDAKEMWETYRQDMISYSGISIFLLGNKKESGTIVPSNGMRSEYEISKEQGNFLIPIGRTGYISKELWNELLEERQDDHTFDIYRHDIESLGDDTKTLDEVIEIVIELIKKVK